MDAGQDRHIYLTVQEKGCACRTDDAQHPGQASASE